nr:response regulator transcription factor [Gammaproteobacteria bacterium]
MSVYINDTAQVDQPRVPTVFMVDDDAGFRRSLAVLVQSAGFAVRDYASAKEFLDAYQPRWPACLLLDLRMPHVGGLELQALLTAKKMDIPIIFVSAHGSISAAVRALRAGAMDFVEKPFNDQELLDRIHLAMRESQRRREEALEKSLWMGRYQQLTPREREVMKILLTGRTNKQIGTVLGISYRTVEFYRAQVIRKMGATSLADLGQMSERYKRLT